MLNNKESHSRRIAWPFLFPAKPVDPKRKLKNFYVPSCPSSSFRDLIERQWCTFPSLFHLDIAAVVRSSMESFARAPRELTYERKIVVALKSFFP